MVAKWLGRRPRGKEKLHWGPRFFSSGCRSKIRTVGRSDALERRDDVRVCVGRIFRQVKLKRGGLKALSSGKRRLRGLLHQF